MGCDGKFRGLRDRSDRDLVMRGYVKKGKADDRYDLCIVYL